MAAAEFGNAIKGHEIEIVQADHQNKPDVASSIAREWFDRDGCLRSPIAARPPPHWLCKRSYVKTTMSS